ncbi:MAG: hypothetical protein ACOYWZ_00075 [Bacillota bacterium]
MISEVSRKTANLDTFTLPLSNSNDAMVWDYNGAQMEITLAGKYAEASQIDLAAKVQALLAVITGNQTTLNYTSDIIGTIKVKVDSVDIQYDSIGTGPMMVNYTLRLIQSAEV